jgi:hypothetical protein
VADNLKQESPSRAPGGAIALLRQYKLWWLLPLMVLVILLAAIYILGHLSSADSETYPTTLLLTHLCTGFC